eukprot:m.356899 g.356899  ORF g.356899 m.356899 type:complete len:297 (-) comp17656_c0_seq1:362-1252(-)
MSNSDTPQVNYREIISKAGKRALGGGGAGAAAMATQVMTLMWLRTTMNYQYRYGTSTVTALKTLYAEGGVRRFYRGVLPALLQGPLSRFGDTAANSGVLALLDSLESTKNLPVGVKTMCSSAAAASWRIFLMPIDTTKTVMQVEGRDGLKKLRAKLSAGGPRVLYHGSLASVTATFVGHFPWFFTFNYLNENVPDVEGTWQKLVRRAAIGFCCSVVSDTTSNSIRVTKVAKQASTTVISYSEAVRGIIAKDGISGLLFRGLGTRLLANGLQGMMFTVVWKSLEDVFMSQDVKKNKD